MCDRACLWVGLGCQRGTPRKVFEAAIQTVFSAHHLSESAIVSIATLNTKASEAGLVAFCRDRALPLHGFSVAQLRSVTVLHPSAIVDTAIGTPSVAEAAAILACQSFGTKRDERSNPEALIIAAPHSHSAIAQSGHTITQDTSPSARLCVAKQVFRVEGHPQAVTVAVAF